MNLRMGGRVALVTGAGSGIGKAIALEFAKEGADIVVADVDKEGGRKTVEEIVKTGTQAIFVDCNVTRANEVKSMVETAVERFGRLDYACNNAGIHEEVPVPFEEVEEALWDSIMNVNLKGVFFCMKYEIRCMLRQGSGVIVNTASIGGVCVPSSGSPSYVAAKHGVMGLTKAAALEYAKAGIRVNAVCPGVIDTPMFAAAPDGVRQTLSAIHPVGRVGRPEEVAGAVMWLCSDLAGFVTGTGVLVDGGIGIGARQ